MNIDTKNLEVYISYSKSLYILLFIFSTISLKLIILAGLLPFFVTTIYLFIYVNRKIYIYIEKKNK
jgi:hypothetical protein